MLSILSGIISASLFFYYDYQLTSSYQKLGELGGLIELSRFGPVSGWIYEVLAVSNLIFAILSLVKEKEKLGILGISIFIVNVLLQL